MFEDNLAIGGVTTAVWLRVVWKSSRLSLGSYTVDAVSAACGFSLIPSTDFSANATILHMIKGAADEMSMV